MPDDRALGWLCLQQVPTLGPSRLHRLAQAFHTAERALAAPAEAWRRAGVPVSVEAARRAAAAARPQAEAWLARVADIGGWTMTWSDADYPARLRHAAAPPTLLFGCGDRSALSAERAVAIIGTRRPSRAGRLYAEQLGRDVAAAGITVVSGLARGIDGAAHRGAVATGSTVAVLGSGLDVIYPPEHRRLARDIARAGAVITEYPPGTQPEPFRFPVRNRLISGLSQAVYVVEAGPRSGTIQTASHAKVPVIAWPGHPLSPQSAFPRRLIFEGAPACRNSAELITLLNKLAGLSTDDAAALPAAAEWPAGPAGTVLLALVDAGEAGPAQLAAATGLPLPGVLSVLMWLELQGFVMQLPGSRYVAMQLPENRVSLAGAATL